MKVGIIGGGPVGLYTAWRLVKSEHQVVLYEKAEEIAGNVRSWGFVTLFSKLELNLPQDAKESLKASGFELPDDEAYLTGNEFVAKVLEPLATWLSKSGHCEIRTGWEVTGIGRGRFLKTDAIIAAGDKRRIGTNFRVLASRCSDKKEAVDTFDVVVDASGSYGAHTANRVGIGGIPAPGEKKAEDLGLLRRIIPDVKGTDLNLVAGKRVGVIGTGYSAITCLRGLCDLAEAGGENAPAEIVWLTRRPKDKPPYDILENDPLPQRSSLATLGNKLAASEGGDGAPHLGQTRFKYIPSMACADVQLIGNESLRLLLEVDGQEEMPGVAPQEVDVDILFSLTGFHPDKELWSEIQVHMCYASDGPMKLAASLLAAKLAAAGGGAAGDCLKQAAPGVETLENPEPNFYVLGMKSYGRNSTFLMRVGYEQAALLSEKLCPSVA